MFKLLEHNICRHVCKYVKPTLALFLEVGGGVEDGEVESDGSNGACMNL